MREPDTLTTDPEILALLDFEPVPRGRKVKGAWTPELQRELIMRLADLGSPGLACEEMGKSLNGLMKVYRSPLAESFREAWHAAVELAAMRALTAHVSVEPGTKPPSIDRRRRAPEGQRDANGNLALPGQVLNEHGEWEDNASYLRRGEEAKDSICNKLLRIRRMFLQEISSSAGKRAAFEILTELPIDWEKAAKMEPQDDEPYRSTNQREPDMILTAESGWSWGDIGYGPDRKAELRAAIDEHRAAEGLEPVSWGEG